jgi:hypothetical protein
MENYILIIIVTAVTTGIVVYALTRSLDAEEKRKWTLFVRLQMVLDREGLKLREGFRHYLLYATDKSVGCQY